MTQDIMPFIPAAEQLPAHLQKSGGLGNENITSDDLATPRLVLLQALSPQCKKNKAEYIEGAEEGQYFNTVTQELADEIYCINLYYEKEYVIWRKRTAGGGKAGAFPTQEDAMAYMTEHNLDHAKHDISETHNHYLLLLDDQGHIKGPAIFNMSATKLRTSRVWNTDIQQKTAEHNTARFAGVWRLTSTTEEYKENSWAAPNVDFVGWIPDEALFNEAQNIYESILKDKTPKRPSEAA